MNFTGFVRDTSLATLTAALIACGSSTTSADAGSDAPSPHDAVVPVDTATTDAAMPTDAVAMTDVPAPTDASTPTDVPAAMDVAAPTDVAPPVDAGGGCNALALTAPAVTPACVATSAPSGTGGAITPGVYDLTVFNVYGGGAKCGAIAAMTARITLEVDATTIQEIGATGTPGAAPTTSTTAYTTSGASFVFTPVCPSGDMGATGTYTATATTLTLYGSSGGLSFEEVYTRH